MLGCTHIPEIGFSPFPPSLLNRGRRAQRKFLAWFQTPHTVSRLSRPNFQPHRTVEHTSQKLVSLQPPQQVVDEKRIGDENQRRLCFIQPIHYRARGQYVFEGKKSGRHLFLIKKKNYQTLIGMIMTQILHQIFFVTFLESNYCQNHGQCSEKKGLRKH